MLCVQPWAAMFAELWSCCWLQGSLVTGMAACGGEHLTACWPSCSQQSPLFLSKVVGESSISAAPVGFASSLLFVHGVDKRVKAA